MKQWWPVLAFIGSLIVGGVFVLAGVMKALDVDGFSKDIALHGIVGPTFSAILARVLVPFEIVVGAAAIIGYRRRLALTLLVLMLLFFTGVTAWAWAHGNTEGCGCFGRFASRTPLTVILEDAALTIVGALAWIASRPRTAPTGAVTLSAGVTAPTPPGGAPADTLPGGAAAGRPHQMGTSETLPSGAGPYGAETARSRPHRRVGWRPALLLVLAVGSTAFALASPYLPIDDYATALRPGVSIHDVGLDSIAGDLDQGDRLLVILDLDQEATRLAVPALNALAERSGTLTVSGLTSADEQKRSKFFWTAAPSFQILEVPSADLRRLYRRAPRSFRVHNGAVLQVWEGIPPAEELDQ